VEGVVEDQQRAVRLAVIVPYFQREAGLLHRALSSVARQDFPPAQIVVVDDGSPRPAEEEITPELSTALRNLTVIRQQNRGVAAARNAALDALRDEVTAIALLDSDDYWTPPHLTFAAAALARGADFFFSNSTSEGEPKQRFQYHPQLLSHSEPVAEVRGLARWLDSAPALMGSLCPFHTSTTVFRRAVAPNLRFPTNFRRAGEDQMAFWELLVRSSIVMFSTEPTLIVGQDGVGTWRQSTFGSVEHLVRLADEIRLRRQVLRNYPVRARDRPPIRCAIRDRRYEALVSTFHLIRRGRLAVFGGLAYLLRVDPPCAISWLLSVPKLMYRKLLSGLSAAR
jgi:succinoglycan biosynthesis protein ExoW